MKFAVASTILAPSIPTAVGSVRTTNDVGRDFSTIKTKKELLLPSSSTSLSSSFSSIKRKESTVTALLKERRALKRDNGRIIGQLKNKLDIIGSDQISSRQLTQMHSNEIDVGALSFSRYLQENATEPESSVISELVALCNSDAASDEFTCTCSNLDQDTYTASVSCAYAEKCLEPTANSCKDNTTFCFVEVYKLEVTAPGTGTSSICYDVKTPYSFSYCYGLTYTGDSENPSGCFLDLEGSTCSMCAFSVSPINPNITCNDFDCSNIDPGLGSGQICGDDTIVSKKIEEYLTYAPLPCPGGCNICPNGGEMTNLDSNVTLITGDSYYCYQLNLAGMLGYLQNIPGDLCNALPPIVEKPCGCQGGSETMTPVVDPTNAPVADTTNAPVSSPVPAPIAEIKSDPDPEPESSGVPLANSYVFGVVTAAAATFQFMLT